MPLTIVRNDLTKMNVDAIVNAANTSLKMGGGVCGAIFKAAGAENLQQECDKLAPIKTGDAVITKGYALSAKHIIHTAGPVYKDGTQNEESLLRSCYKNSLDLAKKHGCESIAFPLISSGIYGYPKAEALAVATNEIGNWLSSNDMDVSLVLFDKTAFALSKDLLGEVKSFIDENYVEERAGRYPDRSVELELSDLQILEEANRPLNNASVSQVQVRQKESLSTPFAPNMIPNSLNDKINNLDEPFSITLLKLIDDKGKTDVDVYKRANIDRKLFSKIRTGKDYMPSKKTVLALAIALELSLNETRNLLERAGFALSRSVLFDIIIEYFITRKKYDIYEINNVLFEYDQQLLGG